MATLPMIAHPTGRPNFTEVEIGGLTVWYSYSTPIAYMYPGQGRVVRQNDWSNTTGRHLTYVDGGSKDAKSKRLDGETFESQLSALVATV